MVKGEVTRELIVVEAARQAVVHGLDRIPIGHRSGALPLSNSGVFAHFKSRQELQRTVLPHAAARFTAAVVQPPLSHAVPIDALERLFRGYLDWIRAGAGLGGCIFVSAAQEYDDRPGAVRERLVGIFAAWREVIRSTILVVAQPKDDCEARVAQGVFEFMALALAYQQAGGLTLDVDAHGRAKRDFDRLLAFLEQPRAIGGRLSCVVGNVGDDP